MKRLGWFCGAFGIMALLNSAASAAPRHVSYHEELEHRAYHRELEHREAHRYPMTTHEHGRLHDALEHEAYHDHLEHRVVHRHHDHIDRVEPVYRTQYVPVPSPARGLGISTPRFSFWITK
jgi:hypothetical protein